MSPAPHDPDDAAFEALVRRAVRALPDAPPALVQSAIGLWPQQVQAQGQAGVTARLGEVAAVAVQALGAEARRALREVQAVLRFDSRTTSGLALGMRGSASASTRQLLFSADGHDVDLRIAASASGAFALSGQVLGPAADGTVAARLEAGAAVRQAALDALGEFQLEGLSAGRWQLQLQLPDRVIALPAIDLGEAGG